MLLRFFQATFILAVAAFLSSCSLYGHLPIDRPLYYDVRDVSVIADVRVPEALIARVEDQVSDAIEGTRRREPLPRVVLTVKIDDFGLGRRFPPQLSHARFRVTAASVDSGDPVAVGIYTVRAGSNDPATANAVLAAAIASHIRYAFALAPPPMPRLLIRRPHQSTRFERDVAAPRPARAGPRVSRAAPDEPAAVEAPRKNTVDKNPVDAKPVASKPAGTNLETGAKSSISLSGPSQAKPAPLCDPKLDAECVAPKP